MGCTEGQPQEKKEQTKKGPRFSEKSTRGTSQQGYYMQMSPSSTGGSISTGLPHPC